MTNATRQESPARVPERAQQVGEVRAHWAWAAAAVWTERMLTALQNGVKGGVMVVWPNAYFAEQGLYSLATAHALARQSARR